ncbi:MAG: glycerate kinase [Anaerolineae bacterium]|nr:glycerate kinase [Anaerolineae bacterium]
MQPLHYEDHTKHVYSLIETVTQAADPARALANHWPSTLDNMGKCYMVGAGKASLEMALKLQEICGSRLLGGAVAVVPDRLSRLNEPPKGIEVFPASHPLPDERNLLASRAIASIARKAGKVDTLIALISGGGSSHLMLPAGELTFEDLRSITALLQRAGAPIQALNTVRKHCEVLKGGGLLRLAYPAQLWAFILSDVVGDALNVIASGPTSPDPTTYADALKVLDYYNLRDAVPAVTGHLEAGERGEIQETLKPGDPILTNVHNLLIGNNRLVLEAARKHAKHSGWHVIGFEFGVEGEARLEGLSLAMRVHSLLDRPDRPLCYLMGGETSVTVHGEGRGGRNQELALAAAIHLDGLEKVALAAFATDGVDGPTDAAGAIVTGETCARARTLGMDAQEYLNNNDSYTFFDRLGSSIRTGPTGTNVNDVTIALIY